MNKKTINNKNRKNGFTMIEMIAALFVVSVGIMGVFSLVSQTISYINIISSRLTAIYLSQEGMEIIRNIRDSNFLKINKGEEGNWDDNLPNDNEYYNLDYQSQSIPDSINNCNGNSHLEISGGFYKCSSSGQFERKAKITKIGDDKIDVVIEVSWQERGRSHQVVVRESLYQWYKSE
jgi:prepilin-type N-terminal cleavage/methylation domain-containing protein